MASVENNKRGLFVWKENHEVLLLREVLTYEPYQYRVGSKERGAAWTAIAANLEELGMKVNQRSVRERFGRMLTSFKQKEAAEKRASGVEVEFTERDKALLDICERMSEFEEAVEQERAKEKRDRETADEMRKRATERLGETNKRRMSDEGDDGGQTTPEGKRKKNNAIVEVLKESINIKKRDQEIEQGLKEREMMLRENQLLTQQQFQQQLLEQQQQFQMQQQSMTMAMVTALSELVKSGRN